MNPLVAQSLINNMSVNPSQYPTLYNYQQALQSAINPSIQPSVLQSMLNNSYLTANYSTNPTLYNYEQSLKSKLNSYLYGSATSMPTLNPALAQSMLSNMTINSSTNPTLYSAYKNLYSQVNNSMPVYSSPSYTLPTNTSALASNIANALSPSATSNPLQSLLYQQFAYNNSNPLVANPFSTAKPYILPSQIPSSKIQSQINAVLSSESASSKSAPY